MYQIIGARVIGGPLKRHPSGAHLTGSERNDIVAARRGAHLIVKEETAPCLRPVGRKKHGEVARIRNHTQRPLPAPRAQLRAAAHPTIENRNHIAATLRRIPTPHTDSIAQVSLNNNHAIKTIRIIPRRIPIVSKGARSRQPTVNSNIVAIRHHKMSLTIPRIRKQQQGNKSQYN